MMDVKYSLVSDARMKMQVDGYGMRYIVLVGQKVNMRGILRYKG